MGDSDGFHPQDPKRRSTAGSRRFSRAPKLGKFKSAPTFTPDPTFHKGTFRVLRNINAHEGAVHHTHLSQGSTLLSCGADGTGMKVTHMRRVGKRVEGGGKVLWFIDQCLMKV